MVIDIWQKKVGVPAHAPGSETATWEELGVESPGLSETLATLELGMGRGQPYDQGLRTGNAQERVALMNAQN